MESCKRWPSALLDWAPPPRPCRASSAGPRGLRTIAVPASVSVRGSSSYELRSAFRVSSSQSPPPVVSDWAVPSMRFRASSRHQRPGSAVAMVSNPPPPSALRFSQPLGGLLPKTPCGLVSSRWHAEAFPFRAFPFQGAVSSLDDLCPLAVTRGRPPPCGDEQPMDRLQGLAPPGSPLLYGQRLTSRRPGALLGFTLSRVLPPSAVVRASATLSSRASAELVRDALSPAPQGFSAPKARLISRETADPLEVCDLFEPLVRSGTRPDRAYRFALGSTPRHRST